MDFPKVRLSSTLPIEGYARQAPWGDRQLDADQSTAVELTATIVSAYLGNSQVAAGDIPGLIRQVHAALAAAQSGNAAVEAAPQAPAVSIRKSITAEHLICLEDGRKFKSLKRHLRTKYGLSPEDYRSKWNLPKDYPMVAPAYAEARSNLAKAMGLGQGGRGGKPAPAKAGRGRPKAR